MKKTFTLPAIALACLLSACAVQPKTTTSAQTAAEAANYDPLDTPEAVAEMLRKAEAGDMEAQVSACAFGLTSSAHYHPADGGDSWCEKAADRGNIYAMVDLSSRYDMALERAPDPAKALYWIKRAATTKPDEKDIHAPEAYASLADAYEYGLMTLKPDARQAVKWYTKAAEAGNSNAYMPLARLHESGIGTRQDFKAAAKWYTKSAEFGLADGQCALARLYLKGQGVARDPAKAYFWDTVAALTNRKYERNDICTPGASWITMQQFLTDEQRAKIDKEAAARVAQP